MPVLLSQILTNGADVLIDNATSGQVFEMKSISPAGLLTQLTGTFTRMSVRVSWEMAAERMTARQSLESIFQGHPTLQVRFNRGLLGSFTQASYLEGYSFSKHDTMSLFVAQLDLVGA